MSATRSKGKGAGTRPPLLEFSVIGKKGEGTFSEVLTGRMKDGTLCAVKHMKAEFKSWEQVNQLREVQALRRLNPHPNIIQLIAVNYDPSTRRLDLVCELMEMNIYERIKGRRHRLPEELVKSYMYQLCKALDHMHRNGIFHRDVKPENVLIKDEVLKLADFGSCRGIYSKPPFTEYISTRWYRPPECLLTDGHYSFKMDMWSVGCVFFETMTLYPLFPGANEVDQISKIHDVLGTPAPELLAKIQKPSNHTKFSFDRKEGCGLRKHLPPDKASDACLDLLTWLLKYDPDERYSARQALKHQYFAELRKADKARSQQRKKSEAGSAGKQRPADYPAAAMATTGGRRGKKQQAIAQLAQRQAQAQAGGAAESVALPQAVAQPKGRRNRQQRAKKAATDGLALPPIMLQQGGGKSQDQSVSRGFAQLPKIDAAKQGGRKGGRLA